MAGTMNTEERAADLAESKQAVADVSDADLYSAAIADEQAPEPVTEPEPKVDASGRLHAPDGKFAPKAPAESTDAAPTQQQPEVKEAEQPADQTQPADDGAQVPSWRLREVREAREAAEQRAQQAANEAYAMRQQMQAMERQLAQLQAPKPEPANWFENPDAALRQSLDPFQSQFQDLASRLTLRASRAENVATHGREQVAEMEQAIETAMRAGHPEMPLLAHRMRQSEDPVGEAMQWFQQARIQHETGGDLNAYRQKVLDEAMKDPAFQAKVMEAARSQTGSAPSGSAPKVQLPPSLNKVAAARGATDESGDMSDASLYRFATR